MQSIYVIKVSGRLLSMSAERHPEDLAGLLNALGDDVIEKPVLLVFVSPFAMISTFKRLMPREESGVVEILPKLLPELVEQLRAKGYLWFVRDIGLDCQGLVQPIEELIAAAQWDS